MKENKEKMDILIKKMVTHLSESIPTEWDHVYLGVFYSEEDEIESVDYQIVYQSNGKTYDLLEYSFNHDDEIVGNHLDEIYLIAQDIKKLCHDVGDKWSRMNVRLDDSGKFTINFTYDEKGTLSDRIQQWEKEQKINNN